MELDHLFPTAGFMLALQLMFVSTAAMGGIDLHRRFIKVIADKLAVYGPFGMLVYVLFEVSKLS